MSLTTSALVDVLPGARLQIVSPAGLVFVLEVPAFAVPKSVEITMTLHDQATANTDALQALGSLTLEPHGLVFLRMRPCPCRFPAPCRPILKSWCETFHCQSHFTTCPNRYPTSGMEKARKRYGFKIAANKRTHACLVIRKPRR